VGVSTIRWESDDRGVVTVVLDDPEQRVNTLNERFAADLAALVDWLEAERDQVRGVVLTSAKPSFLAGGDLHRLLAVDHDGRDAFLADLEGRKSRTRRLEQLGRPVVAVLEGAALGGGLELALACHHRIAVRSPAVVVGLPEVTLGLLPGGGGLVRTTRLLGADVARALTLSGTRLGVDDALDLGLVDEVVASRDDALAAARAWIADHPSAAQPWDGGPRREAGSGETRARLLDLPVPQPDRALAPAAATITALVDLAAGDTTVDDALSAESAGLADLVVSDVAKRTIAVVFLDTVAARRRTRAAGGDGPTPVLVPETPDLEPLAERAGLWRVTDRAGDGEVVHLAAGPPGGAPASIRVVADRLGDGGYVVELAGGETTAACLARSGSLVLRVGETSLVEAVADAVDDALAGLAPADADRALVAAGMRPLAAGNRPSPARLPDLDAAERLVRAAATAAVDAAERGGLLDLADLDVASVRLAGVPAWTGGAGRLRDAAVTA
jgi:enoyl-CoA hydratase/carnithine racemase